MKVFVFAIMLFISTSAAGVVHSDPSEQLQAEQATVTSTIANEVKPDMTKGTEDTNELVFFVLFILLPIFYRLIRTNGKHA